MFTKEQELVIERAEVSPHQLIKIASVAGSGKTHTLKGIAQRLKPKKGLYTAFNAAVVEEGRFAFPKEIECKTLNALAYHYIVKPHGYKLKNMEIEDIREKIKPYEKRMVIKAMEDFFKSSVLELSFIDTLVPKPYSTIAKKYINEMVEGTFPVTFGFTVKYLYLQLKDGSVKIDYDLIMLDEAGDLSEVTIEIFKLMNAKKKIMAGDEFQNIYQFLNTVNGFRVLKDEGELLTLSKSFRVSEEIAVDIQTFCRKYLNKDMKFEGVHIEDKTIKSRAFISRTNSSLISRMMDLHRDKLSYTTLRTPEEIFSLPLAIMAVSSGRPLDPKSAYKFLETDKKTFDKLVAEDLLREKEKGYKKQASTFHKYLKEHHMDDVSLMTAVRLLETNSYSEIMDCYQKAKAQPKTKQPVIIATAHVCKGQTYDAVFIEEDLNSTVKKIKKNGVNSQEDLTELNLYYVACTRCRIELTNAVELKN